MAVVVITDDARGLLHAIRTAIDESRIETWSYDKDGDFTHTAEQWKQCAWLRPLLKEDRLVLNIIPPRRRAISTRVYGIYHGRFIEMLLCHFDGRFMKAWATANPTDGDRVKGQDTSA
jgi:hypothetical protein